MENSEIIFNSIFNGDCCSELLELADGKLHTEDGHAFNIHKIELAKKNKYFYRLFCGIGKGKNEFSIPGVKGEILANILSYIYNGTVCITEKNVCETLVAADYLLMDNIIKHIKEKYLESCLSIRNCLSLYMTSLQISRHDISRDIFRFVQTHFEAVITLEDSEVEDISLGTLKLFLSNNNICVRDENVNWSAIVKWVQKDLIHRQCKVPDLLMHLAVSDIDEVLAKNILQHEIVASNVFCTEINQLKSSNTFNSHLEIILKYYQRCPYFALRRHRLPENVYFIAHYCVYNRTDGVHIYVTYDENLDLWRKIAEIDVCPEYILSIGYSIYAIRTRENIIFQFDLIEKEWHAMANFRADSSFYSVVQLEGSVYVLYGISEMNSVELYEPDSNLWYDVSPMIPVTSFNAVVSGKRIFVVGSSPNFLEFEMIAQAYEAETDSWTIMPPPFIFRYGFELIVHREKLYVIGGRNSEEYITGVEVYDTEKEIWTTHKSLPYMYYLPKATVLKGKLIVYDNHMQDRSYLKTNSAVQWNEAQADWESFEDSSPINTFHKYHIFSPDNKECIKLISKENKNPDTHFLKSPFN